MKTAKSFIIASLLIAYLPPAALATSALSEAVKATQVVTSQINAQVQQSSAEVKSKVNELEGVKESPQHWSEQPHIKPEAQPALVSESVNEALCRKVDEFANHAVSEEKLYFRLALGGIILSACLALLGGITSFLNLNRIAGVISLVVAAIVGLSNAYPVGRLADFYGTLRGQASSLSLDCSGAVPYTLTTYSSHLNQLKLLYVYEEQRPSFGNYKLATDELVKQLQVVKTTSNNLSAVQMLTSQDNIPILAVRPPELTLRPPATSPQ